MTTEEENGRALVAFARGVQREALATGAVLGFVVGCVTVLTWALLFWVCR